MKFIKLKYHLLVAVMILMTNSSCQKVVDLKLDSAGTQLVIEGNVTNVRGPQYVNISQSVPFTNTNKFPTVSGAIVTITDNKGGSFKLTETAGSGVYESAVFAGKPGYTYTLTVQYKGQTYTGSSTMPQPVFFDQLTYASDLFKKTSQLVTVHFQDPINVPNQYRFIMYVNGVQVKSIFDADDTFTDGSTVEINLFQNDFTIIKGDTVNVEDQCIDKNMFTYWFSLSQQQDNGAGGGTAPSNPPSNLSNNALGYFSAHTTQKQGLIIR